MEFSRQEYWSGLPFPSPDDLPDPGVKSGSSLLWANSSPSEPPEMPHFPLEQLNQPSAKVIAFLECPDELPSSVSSLNFRL